MRIREVVIGLVCAIAAAAVAWGVGRREAIEPQTVPMLPVSPAATALGDNPDFLDIAKVSCYGKDGACQLTKTLDVVLTAAPIAWDKAHPGQLSKVALVVSGIPFEGVTARAVQVNTRVLRFRLDPNVNADRWKELFVGQSERTDMPVALALPVPSEDLANKGTAIRLISNAKPATFLVRPNELTRVIYTAIVVLIVGLGYLGYKSDLLRDSGTEPPLPGRKPYSLARTQLAVWTVVIVASYLLLVAVLGSTNPFNDTALILIGVSAATGLTATAIDNGATAKAADTAQVVAKPMEPRVSKGFVIDVLSDDEGVTIYRLQMAVWTLALAAVFFFKVWTELAMPDFNGLLLGLLGVSNGTYVGLKLKAT